jgi:hypothetical protein
MNNIKMPPREREEWTKMVMGDIPHQYRNFALQMKLSQARKEVLSGHVKLDKAVDQIYELCAKYAVAVQNDLLQIFKTW